MFRKLLKKKESGFTIIEVMIVLAIAGLIMVVVFIAVPQLQRNQRNAARNADATRVGASVQNWVSNNNGAIFTAGTGNANLTSVMNDVGATLNQFTLAAGTTFTVGAFNGVGVPTQATNLTNISIVTAATCAANGVTAAGSARQFVILYGEENSTGTPTPICVPF